MPRPGFKELRFADPLHISSLETIITGKIIKSENEALIAMESKFGWLLSGPVHKVEGNKKDKHAMSKNPNHASRRGQAPQPLN